MLSNLKRNEIITNLKSTSLDVLVIGGGITGAGIALDATTRGIKTAVVEMQDFASGTSSRSTKLVHGGLRYLKQFDFKVVAEVGKERAIVYENGPHVTTPEWMLLPFYEGGTFGKFMTSIGLRVYDFLAGVKKAERRVMFNVEETLKREPLVKQDGLKGGGYYVEYRTDDARLTIEVLKAAVEKGATALNYAKVQQFLYEKGRIIGVVVEDQLSGEQFEIKAKKVINATGPWVDSLREKDNSKKGKKLILSKGVHIVLDQARFPLKQAIYFDTKEDKRMIFAIPRDGKAYVGTTDTFYYDDPVSPSITQEDVDYIIDAINFMFPSVKATRNDVESAWAGVRPLILEEGKDPSEISRKDEIWESDSGLITIAGGKLTGYRKMAETIVDVVAEKLQNETGQYSSCQTLNLPISGGNVGGSSQFEQFVQKIAKEGVKIGLSRDEAVHLTSFYGSNVPIVFELLNSRKEEAKQYGIPLVVFAKLLYAIECELAVTPADFYFRRTGSLLFDIESVHQTKNQVYRYMEFRFNWSHLAREKFIAELEKEIEGATGVNYNSSNVSNY